MQRVVLASHAAFPSVAVRRVAATVTKDGAAVVFKYTVAGDVDRLIIPALRSPRRADNLWQHTCFEAFALTSEPGAYCEFNFAPSTEWAAYVFSGYRTGMTPLEMRSVPQVKTRRTAEVFELEASVTIQPPQRLALAAVLEEESGRLSYWALCHPSEKPDFHHPQGFALEL